MADVMENISWLHYLAIIMIPIMFFIVVCLFMKFASKGGSNLSISIGVVLAMITAIAIHLILPLLPYN